MRLGNRLSAALLIGGLAALLLACPERTTEQAGPDPRLEAEVERLRLALADRQLGTPGGPALTIALVDGGELRWVRAFGDPAAGAAPVDPAAAHPVPALAPFLLAVGLERLADQGQITLPGEKRRELAEQSRSDGGAALAAELEQAAGKSWREYLQQEILAPLAMTGTRLPEGPAPALEANAEDLVKLMVDLQKAHAGRTWRRLEQEGARRLLRPLGEAAGAGQGLGLDFGGQGQSAYFLRSGEAGGQAYLWVGFITSGNGAVIFAPTPAAVDETRKVLADTFHWPALQ